MLTTYNKSASRQGSFVTEQVIAPARGAACGKMNWCQYFDYVAPSGSLTWKARPRLDFKSEGAFKMWNGQYPGKMAGHNSFHTRKNRRQAVSVEISGKVYMIHRIIWEMHHGPIPDGMVIDHIDGDSWNNKIENLRVCTQKQNTFNNVRSGRNYPKGVYMRKKVKERWVAYITINGRNKYLGSFDTMSEASTAYAAASAGYHGEFSTLANGRYK